MKKKKKKLPSPKGCKACRIFPCVCGTPGDVAICPKCKKRDDWPDAWDIGGMSLSIDDVGRIVDDEADNGRVFCPNCRDIVVPKIIRKKKKKPKGYRICNRCDRKYLPKASKCPDCSCLEFRLPYCIACSGSGVSSKGGRCVPCKGTGEPRNKKH